MTKSQASPIAQFRASAPPFQFERDTFTFANELVWQYRLDPVTGQMVTSPSDPPPSYSHRCFVLVRTARQFFYHARFEPAQKLADDATYRRLIRSVVARSPRAPSADSDRIVFPGFDCLRAFSQARTALLKENCGGPLQSYFLRSHWRMVFPVWRAHQEGVFQQLMRALQTRPPIVHLFRFPHVTINHGIILFRCTESDEAVEFEAYDPNITEHPVKLIYKRAERTFYFPPAIYWAGGPLQVIEIYWGWCY